jgi:hypothetical protein
MKINLASLTSTSHSNIAAKTSTFNATGVDVSDYTGPILVAQNVGVVSGTTPTLDGKLMDSADDSSYADVSGAAFTQVTTSNSLQTLVVDARAVRKYLRYTGTIAGTTPSFTMGVTFHAVKNYI